MGSNSWLLTGASLVATRAASATNYLKSTAATRVAAASCLDCQHSVPTCPPAAAAPSTTEMSASYSAMGSSPFSAGWLLSLSVEHAAGRCQAGCCQAGAMGSQPELEPLPPPPSCCEHHPAPLAMAPISPLQRTRLQTPWCRPGDLPSYPCCRNMQQPSPHQCPPHRTNAYNNPLTQLSPSCRLWAAVTKRTKCSTWGETSSSYSFLFALVTLVVKDSSVLLRCSEPDFWLSPGTPTLVCQCACKVDSLAASCEEAPGSRSSGGISFVTHCWDFPSCGSGAMGSPSSSKNQKSSSTTRKSVSATCLSSRM